MTAPFGLVQFTEPQVRVNLLSAARSIGMKQRVKRAAQVCFERARGEIDARLNGMGVFAGDIFPVVT